MHWQYHNNEKQKKNYDKNQFATLEMDRHQQCLNQASKFPIFEILIFSTMNPTSHNLGSKFPALETKSWLWSISFDTRSGFWPAEGTGLKNEWFFFRVVSCSNLSFVDQGFQSHVASNRDEMEQQMRNLFCSKTQISWNYNFTKHKHCRSGI